MIHCCCVDSNVTSQTHKLYFVCACLWCDYVCLYIFAYICACVSPSMSGVFLDCSPPYIISEARACPAWPGIPCLCFLSSGITNGPLHPSNTYMGARDLTLGPHVYAPNALATETSPKTLFWPSETHSTVLYSHSTVQ